VWGTGAMQRATQEARIARLAQLRALLSPAIWRAA
jgi:hypothetical protein